MKRLDDNFGTFLSIRPLKIEVLVIFPFEINWIDSGRRTHKISAAERFFGLRRRVPFPLAAENIRVRGIESDGVGF